MQKTVKIIQGDITKITVDAIVNSVSPSLLGHDGIDITIQQAGGEQLLNECQQICQQQGGCQVGQAVITSAGQLPANYVIHAVGPNWCGGDHSEVALLESAYLHCFNLLKEYKLKSISLPNISTGGCQFPKALAARIALRTIKKCLLQNSDIQEINIVCHEPKNYQIYQALFRRALSTIHS